MERLSYRRSFFSALTQHDKRLIGGRVELELTRLTRNFWTFALPAMADDDDQDIFDSLEREASEFTKVGTF